MCPVRFFHAAAVVAVTLALTLTAAVVIPGDRPALAAIDQNAVALSPADRAVIERIERYFNSIRTMHARFLQSASTGQQAEGDVYLNRPGKLRIDYDPPVPIVIVADGTWLIYHDRKVNQVSYLPLGTTPAGILVENKISLTGADLRITHFAHEAGVIRVTMVRAASPGEGSLTLIFADNPLQLKQWQVTDPQGIVTRVTLSDVTTGVGLDAELFNFVDPRQKPPAYPG